MIAFGCSITEPEPYRRYAEPGIRFAAEPGSAVFAFAAVGGIGRTYNLILDAAAAREDLEALVLVHSHVEIVDPDLCRKVRSALQDPEVDVLGAAGAAGVESVAWWQGAVTCAPIVQRYEEHGGGELPGFGWARPGAPPARVDAVDGMLLVLSPWAVRNVRFDEALRYNYGHDVDYCRQVRDAGRAVAVADLRVVHHHSLELIGELDMWLEAHVQFAEKWDRAELDEAGWRRRARRAEAEREAARAIAFSNTLVVDAQVLELERAMDHATETASWRLTTPLRVGNRLRARATERLRRGRS